jgi:hypothetical protein
MTQEEEADQPYADIVTALNILSNIMTSEFESFSMSSTYFFFMFPAEDRYLLTRRVKTEQMVLLPFKEAPMLQMWCSSASTY